MMVAISIIIPVYNSEKKLGKCIESIVNQSFRNYEMLLVDDGSSDQSLAICKKYGELDNRIKVISSDNHGVSHARNLGLKNANGEYIVFCDSDDWIETDCFATIMNTISANPTELLMWDILLEYENKGVVTKNKRSFGIKQAIQLNKIQSHFYHFFEKTDMMSVCNKLYKRSIIKSFQIQFNTQCVILEDFLFNLDYLNHVKTIDYLPSSFYHYRIEFENDSIMKRKKINIAEDITVAYGKFAHFLENNGIPINESFYKFFLKFYLLSLERVMKDSTINFSIKIQTLSNILTCANFNACLNSKASEEYPGKYIQVIKTKNAYLLLLLFTVSNIKNRIKEILH